MSTPEYRTHYCRFGWEGSYYYLQIFVESEWINADKNLNGWELVTFVPNSEDYIKGSFDAEEAKLIRLGVFKKV